VLILLYIDLLCITGQAFVHAVFLLPLHGMSVVNYLSPQCVTECLTGVDIRVPQTKKTC
jgi:hypothetical protein